MTDRNLSEEQARALWERAAQLQAEAAARDMIQPPAERREIASSSDYSMEVDRRAAMDAGIAEEFVEQALQEYAPSGEPPRRSDAWADSFLGDQGKIVRITRVMNETAEDVFEAMRRVLPNAPFGLSLSGIRGGDPLEGGVMTFEVPNTSGMGGSGAATSKAIFDIRHWADLPEIRFRIRRISDDPPRTEVECSASIAHARRVSMWAGVSISGIFGFVGALIGIGVASSVLAPAAIALKMGVVGGAGVGTYLGTARAWRPMYRWGQRKGTEGMERLIDAIEVDMQTGGAFTPRIAPQPEPTPGRKLLDDLSL